MKLYKVYEVLYTKTKKVGQQTIC